MRMQFDQVVAGENQLQSAQIRSDFLGGPRFEIQ